MKTEFVVRYIYFEVIWSQTEGAARNVYFEEPRIWNENILLLEPKHINSDGYWGTRNTTISRRRDHNNLANKNAYINYYKYVDQTWIDLKKYNFNREETNWDDVVFTDFHGWIKKAYLKIIEKIQSNSEDNLGSAKPVA